MSFALVAASSAAFFAALALVFLAEAEDGCLTFSDVWGVQGVGIAAKKKPGESLPEFLPGAELVPDCVYLLWVAGAFVCPVTDLPQGRQSQKDKWCRQPLRWQTTTVLT
jgi:hypothetical protein